MSCDWKSVKARNFPMLPIEVHLLTSTLEERHPHPTSARAVAFGSVTSFIPLNYYSS